MAAKQAMKENLQCTSKYGHLRISQDICHVRMTDIEGFLTIYGHSGSLLNNKNGYHTFNAVSLFSFSFALKELNLLNPRTYKRSLSSTVLQGGGKPSTRFDYYLD